jgi:hypothetical protein
MLVIARGTPPRVGDLARALAATSRPVVVRGVSTSPVLLRSYFATLSECATVNDCALCRRELEKLSRDLDSARSTRHSPPAGGVSET